jgi:hypothetical protein
MSEQGRPPYGPARERTFGWYRVYKGFVGHRKWRAVARATGIELCRVQNIVTALFEEANESRPRGSLVEFDVYDCAATLEIDPEEVARVYAELEFRQWIVHDHIATWDKRQPDREDIGAIERKRNSRENLKATRQLLAAPPPSIELPPEDDRSSDAQVTRMYWLSTKGKQLVGARLGVHAKVSEVLIHGWLRDAKKDNVAVAAIIMAAIDLGLEGEAFRNLVAQRIRELKQETPGQRPLPLGLATVRGGAA